MDIRHRGGRGSLGRPIAYAALAFVLLSLSFGCEKDDATDPSTTTGSTGVLIQASDCKGSTGDMAGSPMGETAAHTDCVEYQYDGTGVLQLTHVNSAFNCCPDKIEADLDIQDNVIRITERENLDSGGCDCICLCDLDYKITDLTPGQYRIEITQLYLGFEDALLHFDVDLSSAGSGSHCENRSRYPWLTGD